jgi:hypothetical protein
MTTAVAMHNVVKVEVSPVKNLGEENGFATRTIIVTNDNDEILEITLYGTQGEEYLGKPSSIQICF